jgi:hypothetical protein
MRGKSQTGASRMTRTQMRMKKTKMNKVRKARVMAIVMTVLRTTHCSLKTNIALNHLGHIMISEYLCI